MYKMIFVLAFGLIVSGCGGRDARPVDVFRPGDESLSCKTIDNEIAYNNRQIKATVSELESSKGQNVAVGVVGAILFWPALFALDVSDAEKVEIQALEERNRHLYTMASERECNLTEDPISSQEVAQENIEAKQEDSATKYD